MKVCLLVQVLLVKIPGWLEPHIDGPPYVVISSADDAPPEAAGVSSDCLHHSRYSKVHSEANGAFSSLLRMPLPDDT